MNWYVLYNMGKDRQRELLDHAQRMRMAEAGRSIRKRESRRRSLSPFFRRLLKLSVAK
ncbi:MAG TPA: hypothetical protein VMW73_09210 [Spirochaetia bacterium]|nr:hypothetical protein [Spirochaetia bacterium]